MELDPTTPSLPRLNLPIPEEGLAEVLGAWNGRGQLWAALAAVEDDWSIERSWTPRDVERRAKRILMEKLLDPLAKWPSTSRAWIDALPGELLRPRTVSSQPFGGVSWRDTRLSGWPPKEFRGRRRSREPNTLLLTSFRWILEELRDVRGRACEIDSDIDREVRGKIESAFSVVEEVEAIAAANPSAPSSVDLAALRAEGTPWSLLVPVGAQLLRLHARLPELARELIMPIEDLRWRLFHLAVLGQLLRALKHSGCEISSVRPLSRTTVGPAYVVKDSRGRDWDLWFEAAGAWGYYGRVSPYVLASTSVTSSSRPLGSDLMLILPDEAALIIECKFSENPTVVARAGYEQMLAYMAECRGGMAPFVVGLVVGPEGVVLPPDWTPTFVGTIGIGPPSAVQQGVERAMSPMPP